MEQDRVEHKVMSTHALDMLCWRCPDFRPKKYHFFLSPQISLLQMLKHLQKVLSPPAGCAALGGCNSPLVTSSNSHVRSLTFSMDIK